MSPCQDSEIGAFKAASPHVTAGEISCREEKPS